MRDDHLLCVRHRKFVVTNDSNHGRKTYRHLAGDMVLRKWFNRFWFIIPMRPGCTPALPPPLHQPVTSLR